jgi:hypothetical protein
MSHTKHNTEAEHEEPAAGGPLAARVSTEPQAAPACRAGERGSAARIAPNATATGAARRLRKGRASDQAEPEIELTIDLESDEVLEAVANLLLDLTRHKYEQST